MKIHKLMALALLMMAAMACASKENASQTNDERSSTRYCMPDHKDSPSSSWSLGDQYSGSLEVRGADLATICVYRHGVTVIDHAQITFGADEFVASQTCSYREQTSRSIFGVGIRGRGNDVALRLAWDFDKDTHHLKSIDPALVRCIYSEMDE